jgi:hypothetical protein
LSPAVNKLTIASSSCQLWIMNCELWIMNCELWIVNYELWIMNYELWIVNCIFVVKGTKKSWMCKTFSSFFILRLLPSTLHKKLIHWCTLYYGERFLYPCHSPSLPSTFKVQFTAASSLYTASLYPGCSLQSHSRLLCGDASSVLCQQLYCNLFSSPYRFILLGIRRRQSPN